MEAHKDQQTQPDSRAEAGQESASTIRYCEDCRFFLVTNTGASLGRCAAPDAPRSGMAKASLSREFDTPEQTRPFAEVMREFDHRCGPEAKWFEATPAIPQAAE